MAPSITIELPPSLTTERLSSLLRRLHAAVGEDGRVLVLRGTAEAFCRGMDLAVAGEEVAAMAIYADLLCALRACPKPTLAVAEGAAIGGGLGLLAVCDVVIATDAATFGLPEALYGFIPAAVFPSLLDRLLPQKARSLCLDGLARDASWALAHGLIDERCAPEQVASAVRAQLRRLGRAQPAAVRLLREVSHDAAEMTTERAIRAGAARTARSLSDPALARRLRAFALEGVSPWGEP
jgi:enoyl-CoA hydratase/carnithine racemase